jgi:hypothetical protein
VVRNGVHGKVDCFPQDDVVFTQDDVVFTQDDIVLPAGARR